MKILEENGYDDEVTNEESEDRQDVIKVSREISINQQNNSCGLFSKLIFILDLFL